MVLGEALTVIVAKVPETQAEAMADQLVSVIKVSKVSN
jgi:hypothetical protein